MTAVSTPCGSFRSTGFTVQVTNVKLNVRLQAVLNLLVEQPAVYWVAPAPKLHIANFYATGIVQNGAAGSVDMAAGTSSPYPSTHNFSVAGLQARGMIPPHLCAQNQFFHPVLGTTYSGAA